MLSVPHRAVGAVLTATLALAIATPASALPSHAEVKRSFQSSDTLLLDRRGEVLHRLRTDPTVRRGNWVPIADVSPALRSAIVLSEDRRFYEHSGVDWQAVTAAAWANLFNTRTRGASTLTMQLAGLFDDPASTWLRAGPGGRSVVQKLGQTVAAQRLDAQWRKDQILEAYLNLVPFRGEIVGIDALSRSLFGKAPHGLDTREAAVATALVRAPNASPARVARRACGVLRALQPGTGTKDCEALDLFVTGTLQRRAWAPSEGIAPHLARRLLTDRSRPSAAERRTSLDAPLQRFALQTLQRHLRELRGRQVEDGAVVVLDNATGEVLAWVGSSGELSSAAEVDGVTALRQPGSTLKPFLYAQAIAARRLTAASLLEDAPTQIPTANGLYIPQNYDHQFKGWVSVRTALGASLNVPAVRALVMVTPDAFARQLGALGLTLKENGEYYGTSLALGSAEVSLLALTNAYRALSNGGRASAVVWHPGARPTFQPALDPRAAFIVSDILADPNARVRTFGSDSVLATRFWTAVKTGTSKDMRDNWAVGYSQRYTVGVWVGNASGSPMHNVSGISGAAPVWAAVMGFLHAHTPSRPPTAPASVQRLPVHFGQALEAPRDEWFLPGTGQPLFAIHSIADSRYTTTDSGQKGLKSIAHRPREATRIIEPADGTILALDPDIPAGHQRVHFTADAPLARWQLDGKPLARGERVPWLPWPGRHRITLVDAQGRTLDTIRLEVRGAGIRTTARK